MTFTTEEPHADQEMGTGMPLPTEEILEALAGLLEDWPFQ